METILDYMIVDNWDAAKGKHRMDILQARVRQLITQGWRPEGGVGVHGGTVMQAMVKVRPD
ncbi:MAG TPA: hypothetical protein VGC13_19680 [Longimicrobium sp.]|jgi:hypothetical protein|uniref:hypothetical protein n=1 Tax=Longimicrobium sp. TaxID=2029185 RepID=UPI002ED94D84